MPFRSDKQKKFLAWKKPKLYRRWKRRYGPRITRKNARKHK